MKPFGHNSNIKVPLSLIATNPDMKVEPTKLIKGILNDPEARKQLAAAIANPSLTVTLKGKSYMLESIR